MLSRDTVNFHLSYLATAMRRKLDDRVVDIFHRECGRTMDDDQFTAAVATVLDEDDKFPSIARLKAAGKGHRRRERGEAHVLGIGSLTEYLADIDAGRSPGGDDQYRGRPGVKPMVERLVYEDAAIMVEALPGEGLTARLRRIAAKAEAELARMSASATAPAPPEPIQGEL